MSSKTAATADPNPPAPAPSGEESAPLTCRECGVSFDEAAQQKRFKKDYVRVHNGVICRDRPSCRSRQLAVTLGLNLYSRHPRETLIARMSIRPANWQAIEWRPSETEAGRMEAAIEYFSWCYPVCMPYAVQIDPDDEICKDRYGKPVPHTYATLAAFLGLAPQNVLRALKWLELRKRIRRDEDGWIYLEPRPHLTDADRRALARQIDGDKDPAGILEDVTVPSSWVPVIENLLGDPAITDEISTDLLTAVRAACTEHNESLAVIRTTRLEALKTACTRAATLLSRSGDVENLSPPPSSLPNQSRSSPGTQEGGRGSKRKQLPALPGRRHGNVEAEWATGEGKGALGKLRPKEAAPPKSAEREESNSPATVLAIEVLQMVRVLNKYGPATDGAAKNLILACRKNAPDSTIQEIEHFTHTKGRELNPDVASPIGFLVKGVPEYFAGESFRLHRIENAEPDPQLDDAWAAIDPDERERRLTEASPVAQEAFERAYAPGDRKLNPWRNHLTHEDRAQRIERAARMKWEQESKQSPGAGV